jgi:hypothetical protein
MSFNTTFQSCVFNNSGELYAVGQKADDLIPNTAVGIVVRYDDSGTILSQRQFAEAGKAVFISDVAVLPGGDVLLAIRGSASAQVLRLTPDLSTIVWSKNIGVLMNIQGILVSDTAIYLCGLEAVAKIAINGDTLWVTLFDSMTWVSMTLDSTNNVVVYCVNAASAMGSAYIFSLNNSDGTYITGKQVIHGSYTAAVLSKNIIAKISDGYIIGHWAGRTELAKLATDWTSTAWTVDMALPTAGTYEQMYFRVRGSYIYAIGYDNTWNGKLHITKLDLSGNKIWTKEYAEPSGTAFPGWFDYGLAAVDATTDRVGMCGYTASDAAIYTANNSSYQAFASIFDNDPAFSFNIITDPTHISPGTLTTTVVTSPITTAPLLDTDVGIVILPAAP